jgi:hypothetical protein
VDRAVQCCRKAWLVGQVELARRWELLVVDALDMADAPPPLPGSTLSYKDRKTGLVIFGIVEILLGCLAVLLIGLMVVGQIMLARNTGEPPRLQMILPTTALYGVMAIVLITLGIGSMRARRWARALSLVLSWAWLVAGLCALGATVFILPGVLRTAGGGGPGLPPQAMVVVTVVAVCIVGLFFVLVPGMLVLFYQSRHIKATCENRDPQVRWTDSCPLPVLGLSLWLGLGAAYLLLMPFFMNGVFPVFGVILSGWSGSLAYFIMAGLWIYCAFASYQLETAGWWLVLLSVCVMSVSALISFSRIEFSELYRQMGYSQDQIQMMTQFSFLQGRNIGYLSLAGAIPLLVYLLWVKRFFRPAS